MAHFATVRDEQQENPVLKTKPVLAAKGRHPKAKATPQVGDETISELAEVFKILADRSRLKILLALARDGEMHVSALCELLEQSQPAVSHHLTLLRMQDLVTYRRDGKHNFYRVDSSRVRQLLEEFFTGVGNGSKLLQFPDFSLAYRGK